MDILSEKWVYRFHQILKRAVTQNICGHWANLCHPFPFPQPPSKAPPVLPFECYSLLTPVSCHLHLHHIVLSKSSSWSSGLVMLITPCLLGTGALHHTNVQIPGCRHHALFISVSSVSGWSKRLMLFEFSWCQKPSVSQLLPLYSASCHYMSFIEIYFPTNSIIWLSVGSLNIIRVSSPCIL